MAGKLVFATDPLKKEHPLAAEDLEGLGEIGQGRYGRVTKVLHRPTGMLMAVKVG